MSCPYNTDRLNDFLFQIAQFGLEILIFAVSNKNRWHDCYFRVKRHYKNLAGRKGNKDSDGNSDDWATEIKDDK